MLIPGVICGFIGANSGPGTGLGQRVNTGAFGFWQIATALYLLRSGADLRRRPMF